MMTNRSRFVMLSSLLLLGLILLLAVPYFLKQIPQQLANTVKSHLQANNIKWAGVMAEGRNIFISGTAPSAAEHVKAIKTAEQVVGVKQVVDRMSRRVIDPYVMRLVWNGEQLHFSGYIPDSESHETVLRLAFDLFKKPNVYGELEQGEGQPEQWTEATEALINSLSHMRQGSVEMVDQVIYLSGKTQTTKQKDEINRALNTFKKAGYEVSTHIVSEDTGALICQRKFNSLLSKEKINFASGQSIIQENSMSLLKELSNTAALCPKSQIKIVGHTDNQGVDEANMILSKRRAQSVVAYLIQQGIIPSRLNAIGQGKDKPMASNTTKEGRSKNRRIEFIVEGY